MSGGKGTRLRPLTHTGAKQLLPVANKPVLFYALEALMQAGITDIGIVTGHDASSIGNVLGDGRRWGARLTYLRQESPLGLAHAVQTAREFIGGESFLLYLGDNLLQEGLAAPVARFREQKPDCLVALDEVKDPRRFGVAEVRDGRVVRVVEKPRVPPGNLALVGVYIFNSKIFTAISRIKPSWRNELEITDAIQWLIEHDGRVEPHAITGWWKDIGRPEDLLEANRLVLSELNTEINRTIAGGCRISEPVVTGAGSTVEGSHIRGPVIIGSNCRVQNAVIGPYVSLGDGSTICDTRVENSIILEKSVIDGIPFVIQGSVIGRRTRIAGRHRRPGPVNMALGDDSLAYL